MADKKRYSPRSTAPADVDREPSSPVFTSLGLAFGMAIGELALALGSDGDVELALCHAELTAKATLLAGAGRSHGVC